MKTARTVIILLAFITAVVMPSAAQAICMINQLGVLYQDTDCDKIIDYDDMTDANFDGIPDGERIDNCPTRRNGDCDVDQLDCDVDEDGVITDIELQAGYQIDWNKDGAGDACDDADFDGIVDYLDTCRSVYNPTQDPAFCTDTDGDRFEDPIDNCPTDYNTGQIDSDSDGVGDACDNCRNIFNPSQTAIDCPQDDGSGSGGGGTPPSYNSNPPQPLDGYNYTVGQGTVKGNGYGNSCSMSAVAAAPSAYAAFLLFFLAAAASLFRHRRST
jgi:hypothetical protein